MQRLFSAGDRLAGRALILMLLCGIIGAGVPMPAHAAGGQLYVSSTSRRTDATLLDGQTLTGEVFVHAEVGRGAQRVTFRIDGQVQRVDYSSPYLLNDTAANGTAVPFAVEQLGDGLHTIEASVAYKDGTSALVTGRFRVGTAAPLTWDPPASPNERVLTITRPGTYNLSADTDYVVEAPNRIDGPVHLRGGRNIVWIGGHIHIPHQGAGPVPYTRRRGLVISDVNDSTGSPAIYGYSRDGRVVHVEGLLIDGPDLTQGVLTNAPKAVVQLQNVRIDGVHFRNSDDRDGTQGWQRNDPMALRTSGSQKELRIDGLTATSAATGLTFAETTTDRTLGPLWLRRVNVTASEHLGDDGVTYAGHRMLAFDPRKVGTLRIDPGTVWVQEHRDAVFADALGNPRPAIETDTTGTYAAWPSSPVKGWDGTGTGRVYRGVPASGDYVSTGQAGLAYDSPGYDAGSPASTTEPSLEHPTPLPSSDLRTRLTWAAPDTGGYTPLSITAAGTYNLRSDTDYVVSAPSRIDGSVHLRGGRNVVWIGGHISIPFQGTGPVGPSLRRGLTISDIDALGGPVATHGASRDGRVVHIEGLLIDGPDLTEGINTNAPKAVVQLQNIRIDGVHFRNSDDRDGTGGWTANHPDILQTWGSQKELRVDGLTGTSSYQGLFLKEDSPDSVHGPMWLRRVNLRSYEHTGNDGVAYAGHRMLSWYGKQIGTLHLDTGTVWVGHHTNSGWNASFPNPAGGSGTFWRDRYWNGTRYVTEEAPGGASFGDALGNLRPERITEDGTGAYAQWSSAQVRDWSGQAHGRVYSGAPAGGDYVPEGLAGPSYRSPGYQTSS